MIGLIITKSKQIKLKKINYQLVNYKINKLQILKKCKPILNKKKISKKI